MELVLHLGSFFPLANWYSKPGNNRLRKFTKSTGGHGLCSFIDKPFEQELYIDLDQLRA